MSKMVYVLTCANNSHMYGLETVRDHTNDGVVKLSYYEHDHQWTNKVRGEYGLQLQDCGDGVVISTTDGNRIELNYAEIDEMRALLQFYDQDSGLQQFPTTTVKLKEE